MNKSLIILLPNSYIISGLRTGNYRRHLYIPPEVELDKSGFYFYSQPQRLSKNYSSTSINVVDIEENPSIPQVAVYLALMKKIKAKRQVIELDGSLIAVYSATNPIGVFDSRSPTFQGKVLNGKLPNYDLESILTNINNYNQHETIIEEEISKILNTVPASSTVQA